MVLGDGEEVVSEINAAVATWKAGGRTPGSRERVLRELATVPGVYVPSMYEVAYAGEALVSATVSATTRSMPEKSAVESDVRLTSS